MPKKAIQTKEITDGYQIDRKIEESPKASVHLVTKQEAFLLTNTMNQNKEGLSELVLQQKFIVLTEIGCKMHKKRMVIVVQP